MLAGVLVLFAGRLVINRTPVADWLVAPLLMSDTNGKADAIVVLGAGVVGECGPNYFSLDEPWFRRGCGGTVEHR